MAANDNNSILEILRNEFTDADLRKHLEYLKAAYLKEEKRQKLFGSIMDKVYTAAALTVLIFIGNAVITATKQFFNSGN